MGRHGRQAGPRRTLQLRYATIIGTDMEERIGTTRAAGHACYKTRGILNASRLFVMLNASRPPFEGGSRPLKGFAV